MLFNIRIDKVYDLHVHVKITMDDGVKLNGWIQIMVNITSSGSKNRTTNYEVLWMNTLEIPIAFG